MVDLYIYLDESGDLGAKGSKFFSVVALCTKNPKPIENMIKRVRERKLRKTLKELNELKGNNSSPEIRKHILSKIAKMDCSISIIVIPKEQIVKRLDESKERLYNEIVGLLIKNMKKDGKIMEVIIDRKTNNRLLQEDFNSYIKSQIAQSKPLSKVECIHLESHQSGCLQAADFIVWSTNRKYSFNDAEYFKIIESKVEKVEFEN